jgi:hypothetical protein
MGIVGSSGFLRGDKKCLALLMKSHERDTTDDRFHLRSYSSRVISQSRFRPTHHEIDPCNCFADLFHPDFGDMHLYQRALGECLEPQ